MVFVDLEKAYDSIPRELIWYCLRKRQISEACITVIMGMYKDSTTKVITSAGETRDFKVEIGLHQGSVLSPLLFIIIMDVISEDTEEDSPWSMLFANNLVLQGVKQDKLEKKLDYCRSYRKGVK